MKYLMFPEGKIEDKMIPDNVIFMNVKDIAAAGMTQDEAIHEVAKRHMEPTAINIFDMDACTTTSDGLCVEGAIVRMGASDRGRVNPDFGILPMYEFSFDEKMLETERHLIQWKKLFPERKLFRGPDPSKKIIPIHNVVISGRASNNNSATEMMNIVTMDEVLYPIIGQLESQRDGELLVGWTGETMSVGIGMTVAEQYGRVFPHPQFKAGETAHNSGPYAKTLKQWIPCIVASKQTMAKYIIRALDCGCVPGRDIGCSPLNLAVARALGNEIAFDNIADSAWAELASVGITRAWAEESLNLSPEEVIERADELLPGVEDAKKYKAHELIREYEL